VAVSVTLEKELVAVSSTYQVPATSRPDTVRRSTLSAPADVQSPVVAVGAAPKPTFMSRLPGPPVVAKVTVLWWARTSSV